MKTLNLRIDLAKKIKSKKAMRIENQKMIRTMGRKSQFGTLIDQEHYEAIKTFLLDVLEKEKSVFVNDTFTSGIRLPSINKSIAGSINLCSPCFSHFLKGHTPSVRSRHLFVLQYLCCSRFAGEEPQQSQFL